MNIVLHIERLVFDGIALNTGDRSAVVQALSEELARLLARGGLHPDLLAGGAHASAAGGAIAAGGGADRLGKDIARAVHAGIGQSTSSERGGKAD